MQKRKKRFNSLSKLQKGILFFFVLVAVSLIGFVVAAIGGNPFVLVFNSKKENSMKLRMGLKVDDVYLNAVDYTNKITNNPEYLISQNGATKKAESSLREGYICQFLHEVSIKDEHIDKIENKIKENANIGVEVNFYLIPNVLKTEEPETFMNKIDTLTTDLPLCLNEYQYTDGDKDSIKKDFFGSHVVFNNEKFNSKIKNYSYDWAFTTTSPKIPTPTEISSGVDKFSVYRKYSPENMQQASYPKAFAKDYYSKFQKMKSLILINFWNEMSLDDYFFEKIKIDKTKYISNVGDLTLFTQVVYTLVDEKGDIHTFTADPNRPQLTNMKLNSSNVDGTAPSAKRQINITKREKDIARTVTATR